MPPTNTAKTSKAIAATKPNRSSLADADKKTLALGRAQGRVVRHYLEALERNRLKRGRKRTEESTRKQLSLIERKLSAADPLERLHLIQSWHDLNSGFDKRDGAVDDIAAFEKEFIHAARAYGDRKGISYATWREAGVPTGVLARAGIGPGDERVPQFEIFSRFNELVDLLTPERVPPPAWVAQAQRNAEARHRFLEEFGALDAPTVALLAGSGSQNQRALAQRWRAEGKVFGIESKGRVFYPGFQFDPDTGRPKEAVARVLEMLPDGLRRGGWPLALWWDNALDVLNWHRPVDVLDEDPDAVVAAAKSEAVEWASARVH